MSGAPVLSSSYQAVAMGASAGGVDALGEILPSLPRAYPLAVIIVLHIPDDQPSFLCEAFRGRVALDVKEADEKEPIRPGIIYFAPPGYHLLVEKDRSFSLSTELPVLHSRPSIDVMFESAADAYGRGLVGVLMTGASEDGARGLRCIQQAGGQVLLQDAARARASRMPNAGAALVSPARVHSLAEIAALLAGLAEPVPCAGSIPTRKANA